MILISAWKLLAICVRYKIFFFSFENWFLNWWKVCGISRMWWEYLFLMCNEKKKKFYQWKINLKIIVENGWRGRGRNPSLKWISFSISLLQIFIFSLLMFWMTARKKGSENCKLIIYSWACVRLFFPKCCWPNYILILPQALK